MSTSVGFKLPPSLVERIEGYAAKAGFASRSAAVRTLIAAGLIAEPGPHEDPHVVEKYAVKPEARAA
jgi:hypothetical protein